MSFSKILSDEMVWLAWALITKSMDTPNQVATEIAADLGVHRKTIRRKENMCREKITANNLSSEEQILYDKFKCLKFDDVHSYYRKALQDPHHHLTQNSFR